MRCGRVRLTLFFPLHNSNFLYQIENVVCYPFRTANLVDNGTKEGQIGEGCLVGATLLGGLITIILRHLRKMHWAPLASSVRFVNLPGYLPAVLLLDQECLPACGRDRLEVLALMVFGFLAQVVVLSSCLPCFP